MAKKYTNYHPSLAEEGALLRFYPSPPTPRLAGTRFAS
jgi:hypothetical protein